MPDSWLLTITLYPLRVRVELGVSLYPMHLNTLYNNPLPDPNPFHHPYPNPFHYATPGVTSDCALCQWQSQQRLIFPYPWLNYRLARLNYQSYFPLTACDRTRLLVSNCRYHGPLGMQHCSLGNAVWLLIDVEVCAMARGHTVCALAYKAWFRRVAAHL